MGTAQAKQLRRSKTSIRPNHRGLFRIETRGRCHWSGERHRRHAARPRARGKQTAEPCPCPLPTAHSRVTRGSFVSDPSSRAAWPVVRACWPFSFPKPKPREARRGAARDGALAGAGRAGRDAPGGGRLRVLPRQCLLPYLPSDLGGVCCSLCLAPGRSWVATTSVGSGFTCI